MPNTTRGIPYPSNSSSISANDLKNIADAANEIIKDTNTLTTKGDIYVRGASSNTRLGVGSNNQVLRVDTSAPQDLAWATVSAASTNAWVPLGWTELTSDSAANVTFTLTSGDSAGYSAFRLVSVYKKPTASPAGGGYVFLTLNGNSGARNMFAINYNNAPSFFDVTTGASGILPRNAGEYAIAIHDIPNNDSGYDRNVSWYSTNYDSPIAATGWASGVLTTTGSTKGIRTANNHGLVTGDTVTFFGGTAVDVPNGVASSTVTVPFTVTNKAKTTTTATITTSINHAFLAGDTVTVALSPADAVLDGTYTVASVPARNTFTYTKSGTAITSTSSAGTATSNRAFNIQIGAARATAYAADAGLKLSTATVCYGSNAFGQSGLLTSIALTTNGGVGYASGSTFALYGLKES